VEFRLLGLLEVGESGRSIELARGRERALLALLLLNANEPVSTDRLIDELWGERQPENGTRTLHVYVSRLRKSLGAERLTTTHAGYSLEVAPGELDIDEFERLAGAGRKALDEGDVAGAERLLSKALGLWRGPALADFRYESFAQPAVRRLEELRLASHADRIEAELARGNASGLVAELEQLVGENPLWERPRGQLMRALYRVGRQAEALELYRDTRGLLADELGVEPSPELQELERAILNQDPSLAAPLPAVRRAIARRGGRLLLAGGILIAAAAAAALFAFLHSGGEGLAVTRNSVAAIDAKTNTIVADIPVGDAPTQLAVGGGTVWVINRDARTISIIDAEARRLRRTVALTDAPTDITLNGDVAWIGDSLIPGVVEVDRTSVSVARTARPRTPRGSAAGAGQLAFQAPHTLWFLSGNATVSRIDTRSFRVAKTFDVPALVGDEDAHIAYGEGSVWVAEWISACCGRIFRLGPRTGAVRQTIKVGAPGPLLVENGRVWLALDELVLIDAKNNLVSGSIPLGGRPLALAAGRDSLWAALNNGKVVRINPESREVVRTIQVGGTPSGIAIADGTVWVAVD
jgi:YVTN family beta-propeller protein